MLPIKNVMTTDVVSVKLGTPIYESLRLLTEHKISGLPVLDDQDKIVGILSEKDVLQILMDTNLDVKNKVDEYMTREVICFAEDDSAMEVCKFFIRSHIRRVPIVRDGALVGIVSRGDIVQLIMEAKSKIDDFRYI